MRSVSVPENQGKGQATENFPYGMNAPVIVNIPDQEWDVAEKLLKNTKIGALPKSINKKNKPRLPVDYKTHVTFVKLGDIFAITNLIGEGSNEVKVKNLVSRNKEAPQLVIKKYKFMNEEELASAQQEADILKKKGKTAELLSYNDKYKNIKYSLILPYAGDELGERLSRSHEARFEYKDDISEANVLEAGVIYLQKGTSNFYYLENNNNIQIISVQKKNIVFNPEQPLNQEQKNIILDEVYVDVSDIFRTDYQPLTDDERYDIAIQLSLAAHSLHEGWETYTPYIHGDLHPKNITRDKNNKIHLIDFGSSIANPRNIVNVKKPKTHEVYEPGKYDPAIDSVRLIERDNFSLLRCIYLSDATLKKLYYSQPVRIKAFKNRSILTDEMVKYSGLHDFLDTSSGKIEEGQPTPLEIAAVLVNAKLKLGLDIETVRTPEMKLTLVAAYQSGKSRDEIEELINNQESRNIFLASAERLLGKPEDFSKNEIVIDASDISEPEPEKNPEPEINVAEPVKKSWFERAWDTIKSYMRKYPIAAGIIIGVFITAVLGAIAAGLFISGVAPVIFVLAATTFVMKGGVGAAIIGAGIAVAGAFIGAIGGAIAKLFINKDEPELRKNLDENVGASFNQGEITNISPSKKSIKEALHNSPEEKSQSLLPKKPSSGTFVKPGTSVTNVSIYPPQKSDTKTTPEQNLTHKFKK